MSPFGLWLLSASLVIIFTLSILDLASLPTMNSTDIIVRCPKSTGMVLLTGGSRNTYPIIIAPHHDRQSEKGTSHFRSATPRCCRTSPPLHFTPVKDHFSVVTRTTSRRSISTLFYERDSVSLLDDFSTYNPSTITVSSPSRATDSLSGDEVLPLRSAALYITTIMPRVGYADISPTLSLTWAWPTFFTKIVSPLFSSLIINFQIIKSSERAWPRINLVGLDLIKSSSMIFGGFTKALTRTIVQTKSYFSALKRIFILCFSVGSPFSLSSTSSSKDRGTSSPRPFLLRSAPFPALQ